MMETRDLRVQRNTFSVMKTTKGEWCIRLTYKMRMKKSVKENRRINMSKGSRLHLTKKSSECLEPLHMCNEYSVQGRRASIYKQTTVDESKFRIHLRASNLVDACLERDNAILSRESPKEIGKNFKSRKRFQLWAWKRELCGNWCQKKDEET